MEQKTTSRRTFLKVGALAGIGALGISALTGCESQQTNNELGSADTNEIVWDGVFDVVVIGFGAAGASAAIAAAENDSSVLIVDKAPEGCEGGNSRYSSQIFASASDKQQAMDYHRGLNGGYSLSEEVLETYAEGLCDIRDTLVSWGLDKSELLDITDVTEKDIRALTENQ